MTSKDAGTEIQGRDAVAQTIISHLSPAGLGGLRGMIGAEHFVHRANSVSFQFKGSRAFNMCSVELEAGDTYTLQLFYLTRAYKLKAHTTDHNVHTAELRALFTNRTGLDTAL